MNYDLLILYSGGADSRLMLEFARQLNREPYCLLINYEQLHNKELDFAKNQLSKLDIPFKEVSIYGLQLNSALTGDGEKGRFGDEVSLWHVPGRNTLFSGVALSVAENFGIEEVWLGADYSDILNNFIDCTQEFVNKVNELYSIASSYPIKFRAPLLKLSKNNILELLKSFGVEESEIFSGYGNLEQSSHKNKSDEYSYDLTIERYLSFPAIFPYYEDDRILFSGIYRHEGLDPRSLDYGVLYEIESDGEFDSSDLNKRKKFCRITNS